MTHHPWVSRPIKLTAVGYAKFAHAVNYFINGIFTVGLWALVGSTTIPADVDAPFARSVTGKGQQVIVFSHGMASSRTSYSQYCGELASRGHVVAAIEHRDGSAPATVIMMKEGPPKNLLNLQKEELVNFDLPFWEYQGFNEMSDLKKAQLNLRQAEIEETVRVIRLINEGKGQELYEANYKSEGRDLQHWTGKLDTDRMIIAGHSYGATGAMQALKRGPTSKLPFYGGIILDPGKQSGPLEKDIRVPILVVHSESWSRDHSIFFGRPHFDVVHEIVSGVQKRGHPAWFMTSLGTTHPSITDAPLIEPLLLSWTTGATIPVEEGLRQYVSVSDQFIEFQKSGKPSGVLTRPVSHPSYKESPLAPWQQQKILEEYNGKWRIHVAPESEEEYTVF